MKAEFSLCSPILSLFPLLFLSLLLLIGKSSSFFSFFRVPLVPFAHFFSLFFSCHCFATLLIDDRLMYSPPVVSVKEEGGIESNGAGAGVGAGGSHLVIPKGDSSALCRQSRPDRTAFRHSMASQYSSASASGSSQSHRYSMASTSDNSSSDNIETRRWSAGSNLSNSAGGGVDHVTSRKLCSRFPGKEER